MKFTTLATLKGPWNIVFPPNLGAPAKIQLANLESWTTNRDDGVKFFAGTATYTKTVQVPLNWLKPGAALVLDLGTVKDIAQVMINHQPVFLLWKPPYQVDITKALKVGTNLLEIKITNQWTNRQIGDRSTDPGKRVLAPASGGMGFGGAQTLPESGLIGPVSVISKTAQR